LGGEFREEILRRASSLGGLCALFARGGLIALPASCAMSAPAFALECPDPHTIASQGVLQETPAQIEATGKKLASGDPDKTMTGVLADLRARYPKVDNAELVNYVITAYCPVINGTATLSEAEKKARLGAFVKQLLEKAY
jgi:hypothetical protein